MAHLRNLGGLVTVNLFDSRMDRHPVSETLTPLPIHQVHALGTW
jgi:hypothetical protein